VNSDPQRDVEREMEALVERYGLDAADAALKTVRRRRSTGPGRPQADDEEFKIKIGRWMIDRQRELAEKAVTAGADPTHKDVLAWKRGPTITEAARAVMPVGTPENTIKRLVKKFDYFCWNDPKRGFDAAKWLPNVQDEK
jgi:hypothetical protein